MSMEGRDGEYCLPELAEKHPFQLDVIGPRGAFQCIRREDGLHVRVDMPGVKDAVVKVSFTELKNKIRFSGEESLLSCGLSKRIYSGYVILDDPIEPIWDVQNGSLKLFFPGTGGHLYCYKKDEFLDLAKARLVRDLDRLNFGELLVNDLKEVLLAGDSQASGCGPAPSVPCERADRKIKHTVNVGTVRLSHGYAGDEESAYFNPVVVSRFKLPLGSHSVTFPHINHFKKDGPDGVCSVFVFETEDGKHLQLRVDVPGAEKRWLSAKSVDNNLYVAVIHPKTGAAQPERRIYVLYLHTEEGIELIPEQTANPRLKRGILLLSFKVKSGVSNECSVFKVFSVLGNSVKETNVACL